MIDKWIRGVTGGVLEPLAEAGSDIVESRERTNRWKHRAKAIVELAAASWRPWLMRLLGLSIGLHVVIAAILILCTAWGAMTGADWSLMAAWALWLAYGRELFDMTMVLAGLYIGVRTVDKNGPKLVEAARAVAGRPRPVTTTEPDTDIAPRPAPADPTMHEPPFMRRDR